MALQLQSGEGIGGRSRPRRIAYPVAWTVLDHEGGSGAGGQVEVVSRLTDVLAPGDIRAPMANQGFPGADWIEAPAERDVPFVLQLKSDRRVARPDGPALPVWMFTRPLSEDPSRHLDGPRRIGGTGDASAEIDGPPVKRRDRPFCSKRTKTGGLLSA